jgi:hypothetical protein
MAWLFDAATDKVVVGSGWTGGVGTILMWVKRSASASNSHGNNPWRAWSNSSGGGSTLAGLDVQGSSRNTVVSFDSAFSNITGGDIRSDAGWHPVALVMNTTSWALFYGNQPQALTKVTGTKASTGTVGSWTLSDSSPDWFDGAISSVKLFSRALSDSEVAAELADPGQVSATNLVFRATLNTTSTTPETGTTMTAGSTGVTAVPGPALAASSTTISATATASLVVTPVAAYSFDGSGTSVADDSGNGHGFTLAGGNARTTGSGGHTGEGVLGSGSGGAGTTLATGTMAWAQTATRTVMAWIKAPQSVTEWALRWNVSSIDSGAWGFLINGSNVACQARNAGGFVRANATRPTDGAWHHYAATYDGTSVRMYLDGTLVDTQALTAPLRTDADSIDLMYLSSTSTVMDDLRIYDSALTQSQIATLKDTPVDAGSSPSTGGGTSSTTISGTATARGAGSASSATTSSASATAQALGVGSSATTTSASATARAVGAGGTVTTISATATARAVATAASSTTISGTAVGSAAQAIGTGSGSTTISATAAGRLNAQGSSTTTITAVAVAGAPVGAAGATTITATATARDANAPQIDGAHVGSIVVAPGRRVGQLVVAGGLHAAVA